MNEMTIANEFLPASPAQTPTGGTAIEASRAAQEVIGAIFAAKRFPRDEHAAYKRIVNSCDRYTLAKQAEYVFPRGDSTVKGPSIRLAEVCAQCWGNIDFGIKEIERNDEIGYSDMMAYCWDIETNTRREINFRVEHLRDTRKGTYRLTDQRDIYELTANQGARRLRACILSIIPGDVVEKAQQVCRETLKRGDGRRLEDQVRDMVVAFGKLGVPQEAIEKRLGHGTDLIVSEELVDLVGVMNTIKDNLSARFELFEIAGSQSDSTKELNSKILGTKEDKEKNKSEK